MVSFVFFLFEENAVIQIVRNCTFEISTIISINQTFVPKFAAALDLWKWCDVHHYYQL